jgi:hypothetical protein
MILRLCFRAWQHFEDPECRYSIVARSAMSEQNAHWQTLYAAAMLESDSTQVRFRNEKANEAIHTRLRQLPETFFPRSE